MCLAPDLVLLDAVLPGLDGFRVARALRRLGLTPLMVIVTFQVGENARRAAFDAGADGFLAKDEFAAAMDLLLPELLERPAAGAAISPPASSPVKSVRPGSRSEPAR